MVLKLYNTLGRKKQTFKPIHEGKVGMYSCGPTVYNYAHIGNFRTYILNDLIKRSFRFLGYDVNHVMNLTDVDDKTIKGSVREGVSLKSFTEKYTKIFFEDFDLLNIERPTHVLKATETIPEMVSIIKILMKKGYAYKAEDGIYFSISKFKDYGKLAQLAKTKDMQARVKNDEYDKENAQDFALWKFWTEADGNVFWETEIGKGRPGWHIECSAMSSKILGNHFDIHTGAVDLIFPHHTNEIAQSECSSGEKFVNYWVHGGFLTMPEGKMSKSIGNVVYIKTLTEKGYKPMDYRYMCLTTQYRMPLTFSEDSLQSAKASLSRLKNICLALIDDKKENKKYLSEFKKAIEDDLNMPKSLAVLWELVRDEKADGKFQTIKKMDEVFGLKLFEKENVEIPQEVKSLAEERLNAKKNKDFKKSDELREKLKSLGWNIKDSKEGYELEKL
ncbi:MAG: cysteine--tRNA ligase [archaeon]